MGWAIPMALTAVSGIVGAIGAKNAADAEAARYNHQAKISERNKAIADQDRLNAVRTSQLAAEDKRRENRRRFASVRAAYGSSGLELSGSALDVLRDTSVEMALDERRVEYEGQVKNREGALSMLYLQEDADLSRVSAKNAKSAGKAAMIGGLLAAGGKAYEQGEAAGWGA